jgi:hypothetical protein
MEHACRIRPWTFTDWCVQSGAEKEKPRASGSVRGPSEFPTAGAPERRCAPTPQPQLSYLLVPGTADCIPMTADDDGELKTFSWTARIAVAVAVFSLGMLVGTAVAAWVVPPS